MAKGTSILSVRVSAEERDLLDAAAERAHTSLSDFVRRQAVDAAEAVLLERRVVTIPSADWSKFEDWVARPPQDIAALRDLTARAPTWQK